MATESAARLRDHLAARAATDAQEFLWTLRGNGIDAAALLTMTWSRRHLLEVALELAQQRVEAAKPVIIRKPRTKPAHDAAGQSRPKAATVCLSPEGVLRSMHYMRKKEGIWSCVECGATQ